VRGIFTPTTSLSFLQNAMRRIAPRRRLRGLPGKLASDSRLASEKSNGTK
jgi:hypothetical protein